MKSRYAITEAGWHPETQYITLAVTGKDSLVSDSYYRDGMAYTENNTFIDKAE